MLRPYQLKVVDEIGRENALIKMPTGSGKTYVAAEFVLRGIISSEKRQYEYDTQKSTAALFLVPTCDLVMQQSRALKHWIGDYEVAEYFGGQSIPSLNFDVLVSTPQAFLVCMNVSCHIYLVMPKNDLISSCLRHYIKQKSAQAFLGQNSLQWYLTKYTMYSRTILIVSLHMASRNGRTKQVKGYKLLVSQPP